MSEDISWGTNFWISEIDLVIKSRVFSVFSKSPDKYVSFIKSFAIFNSFIALSMICASLFSGVFNFSVFLITLLISWENFLNAFSKFLSSFSFAKVVVVCRLKSYIEYKAMIKSHNHHQQKIIAFLRDHCSSPRPLLISTIIAHFHNHCSFPQQSWYHFPGRLSNLSKFCYFLPFLFQIWN